MKIPKHIAIILDGNRRYSKKHKKKLLEGHDSGAKKVEELLGWAKESGVKIVTLYTFSIENFKRTKKEVQHLMSLFKKEFDKLKKDKRVQKEKTRIDFIGRIELFPKKIQDSIKKLKEETKNNKGMVVNFAMGYGGRAEIVDAVKKIVKKGIKDINEKAIARNLYMSDEPELIIRPSGEKRVSNFLIWQGAYAEYIFLNKLWPEFTKQDFHKCLKEFAKRKRRFGK